MGDLRTDFDADEFACKCGRGLACQAHDAVMYDPLLDLLQELRTRLNTVVSITSGIRCPQWNVHEGGALHSLHLPRDGVCHAADIRLPRAAYRLLDAWFWLDQHAPTQLMLYFERPERIHVAIRNEPDREVYRAVIERDGHQHGYGRIPV